jgi:hypothetical protein
LSALVWRGLLSDTSILGLLACTQTCGTLQRAQGGSGGGGEPPRQPDAGPQPEGAVATTGPYNPPLPVGVVPPADVEHQVVPGERDVRADGVVQLDIVLVGVDPADAAAAAVDRRGAADAVHHRGHAGAVQAGVLVAGGGGVHDGAGVAVQELQVAAAAGAVPAHARGVRGLAGGPGAGDGAELGAGGADHAGGQVERGSGGGESVAGSRGGGGDLEGGGGEHAEPGMAAGVGTGGSVEVGGDRCRKEVKRQCTL